MLRGRGMEGKVGKEGRKKRTDERTDKIMLIKPQLRSSQELDLSSVVNDCAESKACRMNLYWVSTGFSLLWSGIRDLNL